MEGLGRGRSRVGALVIDGKGGSIYLCAGASPFTNVREFILLHVAGDELVTAFSAKVTDENLYGPDRTGSIEARYISYGTGKPPTLKVVKVNEDLGDEDGGKKTTCRATYTFDGTVFKGQNPKKCK